MLSKMYKESGKEAWGLHRLRHLCAWQGAWHSDISGNHFV